MPLEPVSLDDKYDLRKSRIFVTGFQALVRLSLMQKERDRRAGLNTAGVWGGGSGLPPRAAGQPILAGRRGGGGKKSQVLPAPPQEARPARPAGRPPGRLTRGE